MAQMMNRVLRAGQLTNEKVSGWMEVSVFRFHVSSLFFFFLTPETTRLGACNLEFNRFFSEYGVYHAFYTQRIRHRRDLFPALVDRRHSRRAGNRADGHAAQALSFVAVYL